MVGAATTPQDAVLWMTAGMTGLRLGELLALRWRCVDMLSEVVRVERSYGVSSDEETPTKSYKTRSVGIAPDLLSALARHRNASAYDDDGDLVFAAADGGHLNDQDVRGDFYAGLKPAGLGHKREATGPDRFVFHNLRHTFGTTMAQSGFPVHAIQQAMGHAHIGTTEVYMHYAPRPNGSALIGAAFGSAFTVPTASADQMAGVAHD